MRKMHLCILFCLISLFSQAQWQSQSTAFADSLRGIKHIWAVDNNIVWAVAYDATPNDSAIQEFTKTINGGSLWTTGIINGCAGFSVNSVFALNADTAWVTLYHPDNDGGRIMRTNNGGLSWTHQSTALFVDSLEAYPNMVYFWDANVGFAMGDPTNGYFEIYTTVNGGNTWVRVDSLHQPTIISGEYGYEGEFSVIGDKVYFGTSKGRVFASSDRGNSWNAINTPITNSGKLRICEFMDSLNGVIADRSNNVFTMHATSNGGQTWQQLTPTGTVYGHDLHYIKGTNSTYISTGYKTGASGAGISYDGCNTWYDISGNSGTQYTALSFPGNVTGWAGGFTQNSTQGGIYKFAGNTVGTQNLMLDSECKIFPNPCQESLYIVNIDGSMIHSLEIFSTDMHRVYVTNTADNNLQINVGGFHSGIYFVRIVGEFGIRVSRFLKI